jgi:hypothetical protein
MKVCKDERDMLKDIPLDPFVNFALKIKLRCVSFNKKD